MKDMMPSYFSIVRMIVHLSFLMHIIYMIPLVLGWNKNSNFHEHVSWKVIPTCRKYKMRGEIPAKIRENRYEILDRYKYTIVSYGKEYMDTGF